jgi:cytochrome b561/polyisoprenoid-binding protein YceI
MNPPPASQGVTAERYSAVAILLHWLIAAAILLQVVLAWRMAGHNTPEGFALMQLHKSVGITILALSLARLGWRLAKPAPHATGLAPWEARLSGAVHAGFYLVMIGMPLTGWLAVSASPINIPTLLYGRIPFPHLPGVAELPAHLKAAAHTAGAGSHAALAWLLYGLFALHVAGALKHQLLGANEPVLARMAPGAVAGRWLELRLLAAVAGLLVVVGLGVVVQPTRPASAVASTGPALADLDHDPPAPAPLSGEPVAKSPDATAPAAPAPRSPTADPLHWTVRPGSTLGFITSWSGAAVEGRFQTWTADILFSPAALDRSRVKVVIDMSSAATGDAQRDASLPGEDWFAAATHPKATFTASRFEQLAADRYVAHGTLELRGVRKPVDLRFRLKISGDRAEMAGQASLDRTGFGVGQGTFAATDQIPARVVVVTRISAQVAPSSVSLL